MGFALHFASPYWLLGFVLVFLVFYFRAPSWYVAKTYTVQGGETWSAQLRHGAPLFFFLFAAVSFVLALAGPIRTYTTTEERKTVNQILVGVDNSSSMYKFNAPGPPLYCTDENMMRTYPRIGIACKALHRLVEDTQKFSEAHPEKGKDRIGIVRFALYSKVAAYPTSNYPWLHRIVDEMNWDARKTIGVHTEIHLALWDLYLMAFQRNMRHEEGFSPLQYEDMKALALALTPQTDERAPLRMPADLEAKMLKIKKELRDTFFVIFTDANEGQLESRFNKPPVSFKKMIDLAVLLELPVYIISSEEDNALFKEQVRKTGFGDKPREYRGDFLVVKRGAAAHLEDMAALTSAVLEKRFGRTVPTLVEQRKSYTWHFTFLTLTLLILGLLSKETLARPLTDE